MNVRHIANWNCGVQLHQSPQLTNILSAQVKSLPHVGSVLIALGPWPSKPQSGIQKSASGAMADSPVKMDLREARFWTTSV
jgi:hypothetical protein